MFVSQQLIPASSGFDHNSAQKDVRHFPAIQVSCHSLLPCKHCVLPCKYSELPFKHCVNASHLDVGLSMCGVVQKETGISYNRMLFYDDEDRNIHRV